MNEENNNLNSGVNSSPFDVRKGQAITPTEENIIHVYGRGVVCNTESRGYPTPKNRSRLELVLDASQGFIPLWAPNTILRWRFQERSLAHFLNKEAAKAAIREIFGAALLMWGNAAPVKFKEDKDLWDFEIVVNPGDKCNEKGCVLASAFFPDTGRHQLTLYPKLFAQAREEQVDTFIHEIGHIFGLRHFFAQVSETAFPSEVYGIQSEFSIMNYGHLSRLTNEDKSDLIRLYNDVWNGTLTDINGTSIKLFEPYSHSAFVFQPAIAARIYSQTSFKLAELPLMNGSNTIKI